MDNNTPPTTRGRQEPLKLQKFSSDALVTILTGKNTLLVSALILAGISFLIIGFGGWQLSRFFLNNIDYFQRNARTFQAVGFICILIPLIASGFLFQKVATVKTYWLVLLLITYIVGEIFGFSIVFTLYDVQSDWIFAFSVAGGVFLAAALVGYFFNFITKLWKYVVILSGITFVAFIVLLILYLTNAVPRATLNYIHLVIVGVFGVLTIFYIMFDVNRLKNIILNPNQGKEAINTILLVGFRLLVDLVNLVWIIARLTFLNSRN